MTTQREKNMNTEQSARVKKHNKQREAQNVLELLQSISNDNLDDPLCSIINKAFDFSKVNMDENNYIPILENEEFSNILMGWWINGEEDND